MFDNDAAVDMGTMPDVGPDGGPTDMPAPDTEAPTVVSTEPATGAMDVGSDAALTITFSEPMEAGTIEATHAGSDLTLGAESWDDTNEVLTVAAPASGWPEGMIEVALLGFTDVAGNALPTYRFGFSTAPVAPQVVMASPGEGSTVSPRTEEIVFDFDEPMNNARGSLAFDGGSATVTGSRWLDGDTIAFTVEGLEYEDSYRAVLADFADRRGTPLDGTAVLGDGALDFSTGTDTDGPRVVDADPIEGQVEVDPGRGTATVYFDEPMDTSVGTATLEVDGGSNALTGTWTDDSTLELDIAALLVPNQSHRIVLDGYTDVLGNALDGTFLLGDGAIDFDVSRDLLPPFVGFTDPLEGSDTGSFRRSSLTVFFSEEMNQSITEVTVQGPRGDFAAPITWNASGTRIEVDVTDQLYSGDTYRIDFTAFRDLRGTFLDVDHPYLVDGILDWTLSAPTGESCRDALTQAQAEVTDGVHTWTVRQVDQQTYDGSASCDPDPEGNDSVVRYTKTTDAASAGGTWLRVRVEGSDPNLEVVTTGCDPTLATTTRLRCLYGQENNGDKPYWDSYHDVGPGDYYLWFGSTDDLPETDYTLIVEEVAIPPEGETCADPWDTTSDNFTAGAGDVIGTWTLEEGQVAGYDRGTSLADEGTPYCDNQGPGFQPIEFPLSGVDGVIQVAKAAADTLVEVTVDLTDDFAVGGAVLEVIDRCDVLDASATSYSCVPDIQGSRVFRTQFEGPAQPYFLWLSTDNHNWQSAPVEVTAREVSLTAGDTCATAIDLTEGANAVAAAGTHRFYRPSCFREESEFFSEPPVGFTWYRVSTTQLLTSLSAVAADDEGSPFNVPMALIDPTTGDEIGCVEDTPPGSTLAIWGAGQDVCVAVESGTVTELSLRSSAYDGVGQTVTDMNIERPLSSSGTPLTWTSDYWLAATPTTLYMGSFSTRGIMRAPIGGGVTGEFLTDGLTASEMGNGGVNVGEAVFIMDDAARGMGEPRIHRAINGSGTLGVTPWDTMNVYIDDDADAIAYDGTELVFATNRNSTSDSVTHFYAVSPTAADSTRLLGSNEHLYNVTGLAVDATHVYVAANLMDDEDFDGVYRLARADLGTPTTMPELVALVDVQTSTTSPRARLALHTTGTTTYLYFRDYDGNVHVADVAAAPIYLGILSDLGRSGDEAFTYDPLTDAIYLFETETVSTGRIVRLD